MRRESSSLTEDNFVGRQLVSAEEMLMVLENNYLVTLMVIIQSGSISGC